MNEAQRKVWLEAVEKYAKDTPRSRGVHTPNAIFMTIRDTIGMFDIDTDDNPKTREFDLMDLEAGVPLRLMQCEQNKETGTDIYYCDGKYVRIPSRDMVYVSGNIGQKFKDIVATEVIELDSNEAA